MQVISSGFLPLRRLGAQPHDEWMAVLSDLTEIVVADAGGEPCSIGVEKAVSVLQSRTYLEARARRLLESLGRRDGEWRLVTIDFGLEAQRHDCEFLMCFAFQATKSDLVESSPYVEVGFALSMRAAVDLMFILTIRTVAGRVEG